MYQYDRQQSGRKYQYDQYWSFSYPFHLFHTEKRYSMNWFNMLCFASSMCGDSKDAEIVC
jgi:hypothetical protein